MHNVLPLESEARICFLEHWLLLLVLSSYLLKNRLKGPNRDYQPMPCVIFDFNSITYVQAPRVSGKWSL